MVMLFRLVGLGLALIVFCLFHPHGLWTALTATTIFVTVYFWATEKANTYAT
jgi:hypothetical protein